jgi:hypothetical protein
MSVSAFGKLRRIDLARECPGYSRAGDLSAQPASVSRAATFADADSLAPEAAWDASDHSANLLAEAKGPYSHSS